MTDLHGLTRLGQATDYPDGYDADLLQPIPRAMGREALGLDEAALPFTGVDLWTHYELSWLNLSGKPLVAIGEIRVPFDSPNLIESKSLKLYFNSLNGERFEHAAAYVARVEHDLSGIAEAGVTLTLLPADALTAIATFPGQCLDDLDIACSVYEPDPTLLHSNLQIIVDEVWHSHLLRSNCPVTDQPDWASVLIHYQGPQIEPESLLAYIVSFRHHSDFHEQCVERIFSDLQQYAKANHVSVYARYTRRGGLDINPFRSNFETLQGSLRTQRQ